MNIIRSHPKTAAEMLSLMALQGNRFCGYLVGDDLDSAGASFVRDSSRTAPSRAEGDIRYDQSVDGGFLTSVNPTSKRPSDVLIA